MTTLFVELLPCAFFEDSVSICKWRHGFFQQFAIHPTIPDSDARKIDGEIGLSIDDSGGQGRDVDSTVGFTDDESFMVSEGWVFGEELFDGFVVVIGRLKFVNGSLSDSGFRVA